MSKDLSQIEKSIKGIINLHSETPTLDYKIIQALQNLSDIEKEKLLNQIILKLSTPDIF